MKKLFLTLILVLLASGCTLPGGLNLFSSGGTQVKELPPDVISINNITILPSTSVRAGDEFSIYFELSNQDEFNYTDVSYNLYDTGMCKPKGGYPDISTNTEGPLEPHFAPKETRQIEWTFTAPDADKIAQLRVTCPIRFRFDFHYQAKSQVDVLVINSEHFSELEKSGQVTTFSPTVNVGRGPIKVYFDFGATLPVKNDSSLPVYIEVQDKGTGLLKQIDSGNFTVTFPDNFNVQNGNKTCPYFNCANNKCKNNVPILMINKKSLDIRCSGIKTPTVADMGAGVPEKTYFIGSTLDYNYYTAGEVDIEVNP